VALVDLLDQYPKITRPVEERSQASEEDRILARKFGKEYFDGTRQQGYGGYYYDGRWKVIVKRFQEYYGLDKNSKILDVGCAKGFMLHDFVEAIPGVTVAGLDISRYCLDNSMESVRPFLVEGTCRDLPFADKSFDLVISIATIHNLEREDVKVALRELERVSRKHKWIKLGAYNTPEEKAQLDKWNVVAKTFMYCDEWEALFKEVGYTGDYYWFLP
jgi:SAM-dependent methyltransferase